MIKKWILAACLALLALPLLAAPVGTGQTAGGFSVIGKPITAIAADGETVPWRTSSGTGEFMVAVDGVFGGATAELQWRACGDTEDSDCSAFTFDKIPSSAPTTVKKEWGNLRFYHKTEVRLEITGAGGSTNLVAIMRGQKSRE